MNCELNTINYPHNMEHIILASESPRRQEYLRLLGLPFSCVPSLADESLDGQPAPDAAVEELARRKLRKVLEMPGYENPTWILAADTIIAFDGRIYGKPLDRDDAGSMLRVFRGREHQVITALALYSGRKKAVDCRTVTSSVSFAPLSEEEIKWYLDSGEWKGVAGAYRIQGLASCFITGIHGSFSSIVGLPLREFYVMLRDNGYFFGG